MKLATPRHLLHVEVVHATEPVERFYELPLIFWDRYRWAAADVILMEHDDNTNYQTLVSLLFNVASQILSALGQPTIGSLVALGSGLIDNMPSRLVHQR